MIRDLAAGAGLDPDAAGASALRGARGGGGRRARDRRLSGTLLFDGLRFGLGVGRGIGAHITELVQAGVGSA